jgi:hypothetical protein
LQWEGVCVNSISTKIERRMTLQQFLAIPYSAICHQFGRVRKHCLNRTSNDIGRTIIGKLRLANPDSVIACSFAVAPKAIDPMIYNRDNNLGMAIEKILEQ